MLPPLPKPAWLKLVRLTNFCSKPMVPVRDRVVLGAAPREGPSGTPSNSAQLAQQVETFPTSPFPALPSLVKSSLHCLLHCLCYHQGMVREPNRSTQTSSSFVVDNACGRKGSSKLGLYHIWYISIFSSKRRASGCSSFRVPPVTYSSCARESPISTSLVYESDNSSLRRVVCVAALQQTIFNAAVPFSRERSVQVSFTFCVDKYVLK